jgi:AraC-like DNA-binding protein
MGQGNHETLTVMAGVATVDRGPRGLAEIVRYRTLQPSPVSPTMGPGTVDDIARACGFGTVETMHRTFQRTVRTSPGQYRRLFAVPA